jgi:hypothetical protein
LGTGDGQRGSSEKRDGLAGIADQRNPVGSPAWHLDLGDLVVVEGGWIGAVSERVRDKPTEIGVGGLDDRTGIGWEGGIGCAVGSEHGDPLVADWVETDGLVHGVGDGELLPEFLVSSGWAKVYAAV